MIFKRILMGLNKLTGRTYSLPTEAEWEFATKGRNNSKGYKFFILAVNVNFTTITDVVL